MTVADTGRFRRGRSESRTSAQTCAAQMRRGDANAVHQVRARVSRALAYGPLRIPEQDRVDLEQEIVTQIWQAVNRPNFDTTSGFWGFVEVVTSRRCIDWLRANRNQYEESTQEPELVLSQPGRGPLHDILEQEQRKTATRAVDSLEPACRELIFLRLKEGKSYSQISKLLCKSEGALRVQMYRCIRSARRAFDRLNERPRRSGTT